MPVSIYSIAWHTGTHRQEELSELVLLFQASNQSIYSPSGESTQHLPAAPCWLVLRCDADGGSAPRKSISHDMYEQQYIVYTTVTSMKGWYHRFSKALTTSPLCRCSQPAHPWCPGPVRPRLDSPLQAPRPLRSGTHG